MKTKTSLALSGALLLAVLAPAARAQTAPAAGSASATVARALQALEAREWTTVAEMMDSESLLRFQQREMVTAKVMESAPERSAQLDSVDIPAGMRTLMQAVLSAATEESYTMRNFGVEKAADLDSLTDVSFFARWLSRNDGAVRLERSGEETRKMLEAAGVPLAGTLPSRKLTRTVIGEVERGDSAYVVFEETLSTGVTLPIRETKVAELVRAGSAWRLLINEGMFGETVPPSVSAGFPG